MAREAGTGGGKKTGPVIAGRVSTPSAERKQALDAYGAALKLMQDGKYEKAQAAFAKMEGSAPVDVLERVRVHLAACARQSKPRETKFESPQEQYDYAVSLLNQGLYEDARENLEAVLKTKKDADYALYGLAVLHSMTEDVEKSLSFLEQAIAINVHNRLHARNDPDFQNIVDDPRFTELLYPEVQ